MRQAHTVAEVRAAEGALMAALPDGALMQRAAVALAHAVLDLLGGGYGARVLVLAGTGDNGGDALWAGAHLARRGVRVEAVLLAPDRAHEGGLAAFRAAGGRVLEAAADADRPHLLVDGIVGIGGRGGLRPAAAEALAAHPDVPVVAVDVPSGVEVDSGEITGEHVHAALTVTFGTHKVAHLVDPAAAACGGLQLVDIGIEPGPAAVVALGADDVAGLLPRPGGEAHKYTRGVVGLRTGSATYPGAAVLSVAGASTGLVGMVRYDGSAADAVHAAHPEVVGPGRVQAWVVGSGGGDDAEAAVRACLDDGVPLVADADALAHVPTPVGVPAVLTPHAGELGRMLGVPRERVEQSALAHAREVAERYGAVVLLKGRRTLVAHPDGRVRVNATGTPWLATAGAGDVLAGLVGALLAAGLNPLDAAATGAWLHGAAAARCRGPLVAGDLPAQVRAVVADLVSGPALPPAGD